MGHEILHSEYSNSDEQLFQSKLLNETKILKSWFEQKKFCTKAPMTGIELEAWLINENFLPEPSSDIFLGELKKKNVVPEISRFNFEINSNPHLFNKKCFSSLDHEISQIWQECESKAKEMGMHAMQIGTLATLRPNMLELKYLSPQNRYSAMNNRVMHLRDQKPVTLHIEAKDELFLQMDSVIAECAATSLQIHLGVTQENAKRYYNASIIASALTTALAANAPYFFGKELWDESRIVIFEQAVEVDSFRTKEGRVIKRVTFGSGYVNNDFFELFLENLNGHLVLLPELFDSKPEELKHLQFHNGTIWRWNRPIIGVDSDNTPHLRIEHRTPSAGPSVKDTIANCAFYLGLVEYLANMPIPPEELLSFDEARANFYNAAKQSMYANIKWIDGKSYDMQTLLKEIYPHVFNALLNKGIDKDELDYYLGDVILGRILKKMNGAIWQKAYIHKHGAKFQEMMQTYLENQYSKKPLHEWRV